MCTLICATAAKLAIKQYVGMLPFQVIGYLGVTDRDVRHYL